MNYSFDIQHAKEYGVDEAIIIYNFQFWIAKNKSNNSNNHDGRTWTYNTNEALSGLFQFWKTHQIRRIIDSLVEKGVLIKGNYNETAQDRTLWYAFADEDKFLSEVSLKSKRGNTQMQLRDSSIPLSDINTDINTDKSTPDPKEILSFSAIEDQILNQWNALAKELNLSLVIKLSDKRKSGIRSRLKEKEFDLMKVFDEIRSSEFLRGKNNQGWKADFDFVFCSANNYLKILEGKYRNGTKTTGKSAPTIESTVRVYQAALKNLEAERGGQGET